MDWLINMFYYDLNLKKYESLYKWDDALIYLEKLYKGNDVTLLTTIIGFSWYYFVEGPLISKMYSKDESLNPQKIWKKYVDLTIKNNISDQYLLYILGYTLSVHGLYLGPNYESIGNQYMQKAKMVCTDPKLSVLLDTFIEMSNRKKYEPVYLPDELLLEVFNSGSLLDKYFIDTYKNK